MLIFGSNDKIGQKIGVVTVKMGVQRKEKKKRKIKCRAFQEGQTNVPGRSVQSVFVQATLVGLRS